MLGMSYVNKRTIKNKISNPTYCSLTVQIWRVTSSHITLAIRSGEGATSVEAREMGGATLECGCGEGETAVNALGRGVCVSRRGTTLAGERGEGGA